MKKIFFAALMVAALCSCKSGDNNNQGTGSEFAPVARENETRKSNTEEDMFDVRILTDSISAEGVRKVSVETSGIVCSTQIDIVLDGDVIRSVRYTGGCNGNLKGIGSLVAGMKVEDAISRLEGIDCAGRGTSCPDQLARALKKL